MEKPTYLLAPCKPRLLYDYSITWDHNGHTHRLYGNDRVGLVRAAIDHTRACSIIGPVSTEPKESQE